MKDNNYKKTRKFSSKKALKGGETSQVEVEDKFAQVEAVQPDVRSAPVPERSAGSAPADGLPRPLRSPTPLDASGGIQRTSPPAARRSCPRATIGGGHAG